MKEYHKIQTVFKRSPQSNYKTLMEGEYSLPEFDLLKDIEWIWTEKIDGTNIRILWDGNQVNFGGKTDKAQIPTHLLSTLQDIFTVKRISDQFPEPGDICLYGEGFGAKIQKGGNYIPDGTSFILFDVKVGNWWLTRESCEEIAFNLGIAIVPIVGRGKLLDAVEFCKTGYKSTISDNRDYPAEGLVMKPSCELFDRAGHRIVSKIKLKDFR